MVDSKWLFCYTGFISIKRRKVLDMSKSTKTEKAEKPKKNINWVGLPILAIALIELASTYVFATQDNKVLWVLGGGLLIDASIRLGRMAVK